MLFVIIPTATYQSVSSFLMIVFCIICIVWIWAVVELNKEYKNFFKDKKEESIF